MRYAVNELQRSASCTACMKPRRSAIITSELSALKRAALLDDRTELVDAEIEEGSPTISSAATELCRGERTEARSGLLHRIGP